MKRINMLESLSDNILIDKDKCVVCGICVERCILDNLRMKLSPCRHACPLGANCQGYIQSIARGEEAKGMQLIRETLPFPGILGRVCSQPCESRCHRKEMEGAPVAVRALKRYLADREDSAQVPLPPISPPSGKTVAIVGSGPSGMMAAYDLRVRGHDVTIFDAASAPGGMLRWAIPEFRLPVEVLDREIGLLPRMGIIFKYGVAFGPDKSIEDLKSDFNAVIVATGCPAHLTLGAEGENRPGIYHGLPFLRSIRAGMWRWMPLRQPFGPERRRLLW
jgi:NADPH-dependent glutamate synthase beta subunit-like oxidoreductase